MWSIELFLDHCPMIHCSNISPPLSYCFTTPNLQNLIPSQSSDIETTKRNRILSSNFLICQENTETLNFICFRYYPVANLTRTRQAVIIEPLRPEKFFVKTFNATSLYILSICEVCGSYQCPFCPFYSNSITFPPNILFIISVAVVTVIFSSRSSRTSLS